jgi:hypothetical protein
VGGARDLLKRVHRHLVKARNDHVIQLLRHPRKEIDYRRGNAVRDAIAKRIRQRIRNCLALDVYRVHVGRTIQRHLSAKHASAAANVEAPLMGTDSLAEQVLPDEQAALGRHEHAGIDHKIRKLERK